jgi:hypothetical protein
MKTKQKGDKVRAQHPNKRGETALKLCGQTAGNCAVCAEGTERLELIKRSETLIKRGENACYPVVP